MEIIQKQKASSGYKLSHLQEHWALKDPEMWTYYNEGNNNVILRYTGKVADPEMSGRILRVRKSTNREFYDNPLLLPEDEYNPLMTDNVFMKDPILSKRLQSMDMVKLQESFLRGLSERISKRDMSLIRSESTIDLEAPVGMLATNFASFHEIGDDPENTDILSFEIKPKSGVTEFVPSSVLNHVTVNRESMANFLAKELSEKFLNNRLTKFHVMQVSRMHKGKLKELSIYNPFDFFNLKDPNSTHKAVKELMSQKQIYGRFFINGNEIREVSEERIDMLAHFLRQSNVIEGIYKFQKFSTHSLESIAKLYSLVLPDLQDPIKRPQHFDFIRDFFNSFSFDNHYLLSNSSYPQDIIDHDYKAIWSIILGYLITATVKDFTIIMRIVESKVPVEADSQQPKVLQEQWMEWRGRKYRVRVGVIDLETKMYTKIPIYMQEVEEAYMNYLHFHNQP